MCCVLGVFVVLRPSCARSLVRVPGVFVVLHPRCRALGVFVVAGVSRVLCPWSPVPRFPYSFNRHPTPIPGPLVAELLSIKGTNKKKGPPTTRRAILRRKGKPFSAPHPHYRPLLSRPIGETGWPVVTGNAGYLRGSAPGEIPGRLSSQTARGKLGGFVAAGAIPNEMSRASFSF